MDVMKLIAVTGTNGKTTTCFMLDTIFSAALCKCGIIGTVYCRTPKRLLDIGAGGMTTPEPDVLYRVLDKMREDGAEYVFIEATSHALALGRLAPLKFEAAIFTNLTSDHLDFHGNLENFLKRLRQLGGEYFEYYSVYLLERYSMKNGSLYRPGGS